MIVFLNMKKKHLLMLKTFIKVMLGNKKETSFIIPDYYYPDIYSINYEKLQERKIDTLLFDVDNTIAFVDDIMISKQTIKLFEKLKKTYKILLLSNNHEERVKPISQKLGVKMLAQADKPEKKAYEQALQILNAKKENTAAIGDQMLSDIVGAKKINITAILVDQLSSKNNLQTGLAQKLQKFIVKKLNKENRFKYYNYYERK